MTKDEFLTQLNQELATTGSYEFNREQIVYYRDYINGELAKGRTEQQIMDELGDPRLIAKTIKNANGLDDDRPVEGDSQGYSGGGTYRSSGTYQNGESYQSDGTYQTRGGYSGGGTYQSGGEYQSGSETYTDGGSETDEDGRSSSGWSSDKMKGFKVTGGKAWLAILGICLVVVLLIGVIFSALGGLFALSPMGWLLILLVILFLRNRY